MFSSVHAADQSSDYARIVGEMGAPLAVTVWSFVIDEHDDTPH